MISKTTALVALLSSGAMLAIAGGPAAAQTRCTIATAESSLEPSNLCECEIVTPGMVSYIQRHPDFVYVLEQTTEECPAFAKVLGNMPTAASAEERESRDKTDGMKVIGKDDKPPKKDPSKKDPSKKDPSKPDNGGGDTGEPGGDNGCHEIGGEGGQVCPPEHVGDTGECGAEGCKPKPRSN